MLPTDSDYHRRRHEQRRAVESYYQARLHGVETVSPEDRALMGRYLPKAERELKDRATYLNRCHAPADQTPAGGRIKGSGDPRLEPSGASCVRRQKMAENEALN